MGALNHNIAVQRKSQQKTQLQAEVAVVALETAPDGTVQQCSNTHAHTNTGQTEVFVCEIKKRRLPCANSYHTSQSQGLGFMLLGVNAVLAGRLSLCTRTQKHHLNPGKANGEN